MVVDATSYGAAPLPFSSEAIAALQKACWPGNVRQLLLTILCALNEAQRDGASQLRPEHLFPSSTREIPEATSRPGRTGRWLGAISRVYAGTSYRSARRPTETESRPEPDPRRPAAAEPRRWGLDQAVVRLAPSLSFRLLRSPIGPR